MCQRACLPKLAQAICVKRLSAFHLPEIKLMHPQSADPQVGVAAVHGLSVQVMYHQPSAMTLWWQVM